MLDLSPGLTDAAWREKKDNDGVSFSSQVVYETTVVTGDTQYAGTDTNIFLTVFGANGSTEEMLLPKMEDRLVSQ